MVNSANSTDMESDLRELVVNLQNTVNQLAQTVQTMSTNFENVNVTQGYLTTEFHRMRSGEGSSRGMYTRMTKLEFPKFSGDVKGWLFRCQQFFRVDNVRNTFFIYKRIGHPV